MAGTYPKMAGAYPKTQLHILLPCFVSCFHWSGFIVACAELLNFGVIVDNSMLYLPSFCGNIDWIEIELVAGVVAFCFDPAMIFGSRDSCVRRKFVA